VFDLIMLRNSLIFAVCVALVGCGSGGPSIAGSWDGGFKGSTLTLTAKTDSSFVIKGSSELNGRWEITGDDVRLFRDVRNGGDTAFGDGGDGAIHLKLSQDGKHLTGKAANGADFSFTKQ
jgi:hypothetical protein